MTADPESRGKPLIGNVTLLWVLLAVLALESWRGFGDLRAMLAAEAAPAHAPSGHAAPKDGVPPARSQTFEPEIPALAPEQRALMERYSAGRRPVSREPGVNEIDPAVLKASLLQDEDASAAYLAAFPEQQYEVFEVGGIGRFYLDDLDDLIKAGLSKGLVWEPRVVRLIRTFAAPGSTVVDAGAHIGTHTLSLAKAVGPEGRVYAFEPQRKIHRELHHNMKLNALDNVVALRFALGDDHALIEMGATDDHNEGGAAIAPGGEQAELRRIDSFGLKNVSFMKIDVEGFEDAVLAGAAKTIARNRPVLLVEVQGGQFFDTATPPVRNKIVRTIQLMESFGYFVLRVTGYDYLGLPAPSEAPD